MPRALTFCAMLTPAPWRARPARRPRLLLRPSSTSTSFNLPEIAELWRRGSVISSWLLDLTAIALRQSPALAEYRGMVSDSGEGRWTIDAAIDEAVPAPGAERGALCAL